METRSLAGTIGMVRIAAVFMAASGLLAACGGGGGGGGGGGTTPPPTTFTVGGSVSGLAAGASVVLQNSGANATTVSANGNYTFSTAIASGTAYAVTVATQPAGQTCTVANGSGTVSANVTNVAVTCTTNPPSTFTVGGTVAGLATGASVVLQNNGANATTVNANGSFTFSTAIASGAAYAVTVSTQPASPSQTCVVTNGSGTVTANVTNVTVTCTTNSFTLGGTVSGLAGTGLVLRNGATNLSVAANGAFAFPAAILSGTAYAVTVGTQPTGQTCAVANGSGTIGAAAVSNVAVTCSAIPTFTIGGSVSGLATGASVVLQNNGGNNLTVTASGSFTFSTPVASGSTYAVTVLTNPTTPSQNCTVTLNGTGTATANVTNVGITCVTNTFTVGGTVSGLAGTGLVLRNTANGIPTNLSITANGAFTFSTAIASGTAYVVTVPTQPATPTQSCAITNGSGTVGAANVTNVTVTCTTSTFTVGGTISGLPASNSVVLQNNANAATNLTVAANGTFTFTAPVASGAAYAVTVLTQPVQPVDGSNHSTAPARTCSVKTGTGSGTVGAANVTTVVVLCRPSYAWVANRSGDAGLASYSIGATGLLTLIDFESQQGEALTGPTPHPTAADANDVAVTATGSHAFVTVGADVSDPNFANGVGEIKVYQVEANGSMTYATTTLVPNVLPTPNKQSDPTTIAVHPTGKFVYAQDGNSFTSGGVVTLAGNDVIRSYVFTSATSSLAPTAGAGYIPVPTIYGMEIDPTGNYMLASSFTSHSINEYLINTTTGVLGASAANVVVGTQASEMPMALDPTGTYLFVAHYRDATINSYQINTNGIGTPSFTPKTIALSTTPAGQSATPLIAVVVDPSGKPYVYGARTDGTIVVYLIDGLTGNITEVGNYHRAAAPLPLGGILYGLSIDPTGQFLYHSSLSTGGDIGIFSIGASGVLTEVTGSPFAPKNASNVSATGTRNVAIR
jgi:6-phosphogluconolactonase (cycloisomerase 2 family)